MRHGYCTNCGRLDDCEGKRYDPIHDGGTCISWKAARVAVAETRRVGTWRRLVKRLDDALDHSTILQLVVTGAALWVVYALVSAFACWAHARHCEGPRTGRCSWAWCQYYDGSDYLHDFN